MILRLNMQSKHNYRSAGAAMTVMCKQFSIKSYPDVNRNTVFKSQLMLRL